MNAAHHLTEEQAAKRRKLQKSLTEDVTDKILRNPVLSWIVPEKAEHLNVTNALKRVVKVHKYRQTTIVASIEGIANGSIHMDDMSEDEKTIRSAFLKLGALMLMMLGESETRKMVTCVVRWKDTIAASTWQRIHTLLRRKCDLLTSAQQAFATIEELQKVAKNHPDQLNECEYHAVVAYCKGVARDRKSESVELRNKTPVMIADWNEKHQSIFGGTFPTLLKFRDEINNCVTMSITYDDLIGRLRQQGNGPIRDNAPENNSAWYIWSKTVKMLEDAQLEVVAQAFKRALLCLFNTTNDPGLHPATLSTYAAKLKPVYDKQLMRDCFEALSRNVTDLATWVDDGMRNGLCRVCEYFTDENVAIPVQIRVMRTTMENVRVAYQQGGHTSKKGTSFLKDHASQPFIALVKAQMQSEAVREHNETVDALAILAEYLNDEHASPFNAPAVTHWKAKFKVTQPKTCVERINTLVHFLEKFTGGAPIGDQDPAKACGYRDDIEPLLREHSLLDGPLRAFLKAWVTSRDRVAVNVCENAIATGTKADAEIGFAALSDTWHDLAPQVQNDFATRIAKMGAAQAQQGPPQVAAADNSF
ncbi:unnamed protein product [Amoebophrya sp. A25]|nr:unnamed protein product [Amoebophrya sp. A25]|eukprot:GSA25T00008428001.1